jgi:RNA polymerase sigma factor (sigma-70 family)
MTSDLDLLRQFARENSQDAFGEIVRRHLPMVYSAALRQVRSPQLAEDVAQSVFADLAREARALKPDTILTAWLYAVARRKAIDVIRKESRRQLREQIAVEMNNMNATADDWKQIAPLLDDAVAALDETDRTAILLRYFENKSLRDVGESLRISDDAAQKRVSLAVERLREFFSKERVAIGATGLVALMSANAVQSAPAALAGTISTAFAGTAIQSSTLIATTKTIAMTTLQKSIVVAALATAAGTGIYAAHENSALRGQIQSLQQQQAPLTAQIQQLQKERDDATNQMAALAVDNAQLESNSNEKELLKLRGEVTRLENSQTQPEDDPTASAAKALVTKVNQLKEWLEQHPDEKIPELKCLTDREWVREASFMPDLNSDEDYERAFSQVRTEAKEMFVQMYLGKALDNYIAANNGQLPGDISQLGPYLNSSVDPAILQRYKVLQTGNAGNFSETEPLVGEIAPVDEEYDTLFTISAVEFSYKSTGSVQWSGSGNGYFGTNITMAIKPFFASH